MLLAKLVSGRLIMTASPSKNPLVAIEDRRAEPQHEGKGEAPTRAADPVESMGTKDLGRRMLDVQNLLFGDSQRLVEDRLDQTDDRHREAVEAFDERLRLMTEAFERRIVALQEDVRIRDREQTSQRRRLVTNIGDAIKDLAKDA